MGARGEPGLPWVDLCISGSTKEYKRETCNRKKEVVGRWARVGGKEKRSEFLCCVMCYGWWLDTMLVGGEFRRHQKHATWASSMSRVKRRGHSLSSLCAWEIKLVMDHCSFFVFMFMLCCLQLQAEKPRGFARNLDPERIIGATDSSGELMFLMKWWAQMEQYAYIFFCFCFNALSCRGLSLTRVLYAHFCSTGKTLMKQIWSHPVRPTSAALRWSFRFTRRG